MPKTKKDNSIRVAFLKGTSSLPKNIQEKILDLYDQQKKKNQEIRTAYYKELDALLAEAEHRKNLVSEGFFSFSRLNNVRNNAKRGDKTATFALNRYYRSRRQVADFFIDNNVPMTPSEKRNVITTMLTNKSYRITAGDLKNIKSKKDVNKYKIH